MYISFKIVLSLWGIYFNFNQQAWCIGEIKTKEMSQMTKESEAPTGDEQYHSQIILQPEPVTS